jgi:hypothetical protein
MRDNTNAYLEITTVDTGLNLRQDKLLYDTVHQAGRLRCYVYWVRSNDLFKNWVQRLT